MSKIYRSLYWKLTLAFVLVAFTAAALVGVFFRLTSENRLAELIIDQQQTSMEQAAADFYTNKGSWDGINKVWGELQMLAARDTKSQEAGNEAPPKEIHDFRPIFGLATSEGVVIIPIEARYSPDSRLNASELNRSSAITVNDEVVGYILTPSRLPRYNPEEARFIERTNQALLLAVGVGLCVALLIGILLARTLSRPLQALTRAAENITQGQWEQQVEVHSNDEIGQLGNAFNQMSQQVARVNQMRKQMTADIAHDLRTPLTVIGGYIESMRDGVLQPTPERLSLIYSEIERLQKLVGDLRLLSLADAGELPLIPQWIDPVALLKRAADLFEHQASQQRIALTIEAQPGLPQLWVDETRMMQVLDNLLSNAFRYTPEGGAITLKAAAEGESLHIQVCDTGVGIAPDEIDLIFNRFHRADSSRHSESGESGLGLAIVKALVESHNGKVWAESPPNAGAVMHILIPVQNKSLKAAQ